MSDVVITGAACTAVGAFQGGLSTLPASELGTIAIRAALERAGVPADDVSEVILGQVLAAGCGQNPARQAAVAADVPVERTAIASATSASPTPASAPGRSAPRRPRVTPGPAPETEPPGLRGLLTPPEPAWYTMCRSQRSPRAPSLRPHRLVA